LVEKALSSHDSRIAVVTYTNNNRGVIERTFSEKHGVIPARIDVRTWFEFLLHECVRPYQRSVYSEHRVRAICFPEGRSDHFARYEDTKRYYFRASEEIYSDKISRFVLDCQERSGGRVTRRLSEAYDAIFVDELQDMAAYDLDVLEMLMRAGIAVELVGDPRQTTYSTNQAAKHKRYRGVGLLMKVSEWKAAGLCDVEEHSRSHRCNQKICDFADGLFPEFPRTESQNRTVTGHDGVFRVPSVLLGPYINCYKPTVLRYDRRTETYGRSALNFGGAKGMTFERVLILPHGPIRKYLRTGELSEVAGSLSKFYVAVTRARYSVAFLCDEECCAGLASWQP
jgi:DNA helicase-2/ATP-dependent DNA helicase PcrA